MSASRPHRKGNETFDFKNLIEKQISIFFTILHPLSDITFVFEGSNSHLTVRDKIVLFKDFSQYDFKTMTTTDQLNNFNMKIRVKENTVNVTPRKDAL